MRRALELGGTRPGADQSQPDGGCGRGQRRDRRRRGISFLRRLRPRGTRGAARGRSPPRPGRRSTSRWSPAATSARTPPCVDRIIQAAVARVVAPCEDPNPAVSGKGFAALRAAGVTVDVGVLAEEATRLNEAFFTYIRTGRPFVILKAAASLDGKIATQTGDSRWITGRAPASTSITSGTKWMPSWWASGPSCATIRCSPRAWAHPDQRDPTRVIVDNLARLPLRAQVINRASTAPTILAVSEMAPRARLGRLGAGRRAGAGGARKSSACVAGAPDGSAGKDGVPLGDDRRRGRDQRVGPSGGRRGQAPPLPGAHPDRRKLHPHGRRRRRHRDAPAGDARCETCASSGSARTF